MYHSTNSFCFALYSFQLAIFGYAGSWLLPGLYPVVAAEATLQVPHVGFSLQCCSRGRAQALGHRLSGRGARAYCCAACGIFLDQRSNQCLLHWQQIFYYSSNREAPHQQFLLKKIITERSTRQFEGCSSHFFKLLYSMLLQEYTKFYISILILMDILGCFLFFLLNSVSVKSLFKYMYTGVCCIHASYI